MEEIEQFLRRHKIWSYHLEKLCNEIGENELAYRPMPESNSAAWLLVHLIGLYRDFLELSSSTEKARDLLKAVGVVKEDQLAKMPFSQIFHLLQDYRHAFHAEIKMLSESNQLEAGAPAGEGKSWMDLIYTLVGHEIYHCGQLAYISRIMQQKSGNND